MLTEFKLLLTLCYLGYGCIILLGDYLKDLHNYVPIII